LAVALTSSALIIERMEGLLDRSWVAGMWVHCLAQHYVLMYSYFTMFQIINNTEDIYHLLFMYRF